MYTDNRTSSVQRNTIPRDSTEGDSTTNNLPNDLTPEQKRAQAAQGEKFK
jgi:hypothetical protein